MERNIEKTPKSIWLSLGLVLFGVVGGYLATSYYYPEKLFVAGLLAGIGLGIILIALYLFIKDRR